MGCNSLGWVYRRNLAFEQALRVGQAAISFQLRHPKLPACHSRAAFEGQELLKIVKKTMRMQS